MGQVRVEAARPGDVAAIVAIDQATIGSKDAEASYQGELLRPGSRLDVLVDEPDRRIVGFISFWIVVDEVHLLAIAVHDEERRHGHGRRLMRHLLDVAQHHGCVVVTLEVRRSNAAAIALYESLGFRTVAERANYYADTGDDALVMLLDVGRP